MRIRNYSRIQENFKHLLMDLLQHLVPRTKASSSCSDELAGSGELQGITGPLAQSLRDQAPRVCFSNWPEGKTLSHWNPAHSLSRWVFTTELKPLAPQVLSPALWPTGQLPFSIVSKDLGVELHSSCLLNSIVTSFHSFPALLSLPSRFPSPSCYCLFSATPALAVSPNFLSAK